MEKVKNGAGFASLDQERIIILDKNNQAITSEYISVRVKSTHLTGSRYRGGIRFVHDADTILNVSLLTDAQITAINADSYLVVKSAEKPNGRADNEPETEETTETDDE